MDPITAIWICIALNALLSIANLVWFIYMVRGFAEKITLLSQIALQYINETETRQAEEKLNAPRIVKVANKEFMSRRRR
jgi:hypothetical protein